MYLDFFGEEFGSETLMTSSTITETKPVGSANIWVLPTPVIIT